MQLNVDPEGFLINLSDWNEAVAAELAIDEEIELTDNHWRVIRAVRAFFDEFDASPSMRQLIRYLKSTEDADLASSITLLQLYPGSPAKLSAKIAGLPKPENCL